MKRIAFVITSLGPGGAEKQAVKIMNHLVLEYEVTVFKLLQNHFRGPELDDRVKVIDFCINEGIPILRILNARAELKKYNPDLVISFLFHSNLLTRLIKLSGICYPLVNSVRNNIFGGRCRELALRMTDRLAEGIVVNTNSSKKLLVRQRISREDKIHLIYNGIDSFENKGFMGGKSRKKGFTWINVASFSKQKNHKSLVNAFKIIHHEFPNSRLVLVGDGVLRKDIENQVNKLGLESFIEFMGVKDNVPELMAQSDAFVLSSEWEGLPNVVLEAGIIGLPVVCTDVGGIREIITNEGLGRIVAKNSDEELANAMRFIMQLNQEDRTDMGSKLRSRMLSEFDAGVVMGQWKEVVRKFCR